MPLIHCEINLVLFCSTHCFIMADATDSQDLRFVYDQRLQLLI